MQVKAAIAQIRRLDAALRQKTLEQMMVARETQPDKWAACEQRRLARRQARVERLLAKEREEHARRCAPCTADRAKIAGQACTRRPLSALMLQVQMLVSTPIFFLAKYPSSFLFAFHAVYRRIVLQAQLECGHCIPGRSHQRRWRVA